MHMMTSALKMFWQEEDGQDLVEYSLLLAFIALAAVATLSGVGSSIKTMFTGISSSLTAASTAAAGGSS
jgi:pilus assembly protein Flp/PilA